MAVTLAQRIAALERSVREIAQAVAEHVRDRTVTERMAAVVARHKEIDERGEP